MEIAFIWVKGQQQQARAAATTSLIVYIPFFLLYGSGGIVPRLIILVITACASQVLTEPVHLSLLGFGVIVASIALRFLGEHFINSKEKEACPNEHIHPEDDGSDEL